MGPAPTIQGPSASPPALRRPRGRAPYRDGGIHADPTTMSIGLRIAGAIALLSSAVSPRNADAGLFDQHQEQSHVLRVRRWRQLQPAGARHAHCGHPDHSDYAGSQACGARAPRSPTRTPARAWSRIDDQCPECAPGDIDLSEPAFAQIGPREPG